MENEMENCLEICNGCGKVPRSLDLSLGSFSCSRCGHDKTITVNSDEFERVTFNLDQSFHQSLMQKRLATAMSSPIVLLKKSSRKKSVLSSKKRQASKRASSTNNKKPKKNLRSKKKR